MDGEAKALPPKCQLTGTIEKPKEHLKILGLIGKQMKNLTNIGRYNHIPMFLRFFQFVQSGCCDGCGEGPIEQTKWKNGKA